MMRKLITRFTLYLPIVLMGVLALGSWWLSRSTPATIAPALQQAQRIEPDYLLTQFSVKSFDPQGQLTSEVWGKKARHFPATDILEIDDARFSSIRDLRITNGQGDRAYSNADGSEVQLVGNAIIVRTASQNIAEKTLPRMEFRGEFLHAFLRTELVKSHKPVVMQRGADQFSADAMLYNKIDGIVQLNGRVRVRLESKAP